MVNSSEIIVLDSLSRDRDGMKQLFEKEGHLCTVVVDPMEARDLATRKFFSVAIVDLDFGGVGAGLELVRFLREHSPATSVLLLSSRRSFEAAVAAMRLGVIDVVMKTPEEIPRLRAEVLREVDKHGSLSADSTLLRSVQSVLEESMKIMLDMGRVLYKDASDSIMLRRPRVLLVDDRKEILEAARRGMDAKECDLHMEMNGGAALEKASDQPFEIVAVRAELQDLPGPTLLKSIQNYHAETIGLLYSEQNGGHLERYQGGHAIDVERPFTGTGYLVERLQSVINELRQLQQERRYIRAFRRHHEAFLRRYADLKMRIDSLDR
ncbi:MAG: response regulator [Myxococcales bacterium]|nr:MAG: response regulator [Myxococcales bacterium]